MQPQVPELNTRKVTTSTKTFSFCCCKLSLGWSHMEPKKAVFKANILLLSHRGQPSRDQRDPRECPTHRIRFHPGWDYLGRRQSADIQATTRCVLPLSAASNHPGRGLRHAEQALLQQHGGHLGLRCHWHLLERRHLGAVAVGVSHGRSHG